MFKSIGPGLDNTAKRGVNANILNNPNPKRYQEWIINAGIYAISNNPPKERPVFINAWIEGVECDYLEPDRKYG